MKSTGMWYYVVSYFIDEKADRLSNVHKCHSCRVAELGFEPGSWALTQFTKLNYIGVQFPE